LAPPASEARVQRVSANGNRKPPRPRIELVAGNPTEEEGAAVVAALEQFLAETTPVPAAAEMSRWQQAALRDGVTRDPGLRSWGMPGN
jgi:Acyl-CoA carboxylase epsilon subunit